MSNQIRLTPEQWAAFDRGDIADDPERSALQRCCANISALRDVILVIRELQRCGGVLTDGLRADLAEKWEWCQEGHDFDDVKYPVWKTLRSLIEQAGLEWGKG